MNSTKTPEKKKPINFEHASEGILVEISESTLKKEILEELFEEIPKETHQETLDGIPR